MNKTILTGIVQKYISEHVDADANKIALANPIFAGVSSSELAGQLIAKKKSKYKLPTWYQQEYIYYPILLSIEQCSSELTASYKANLAIGSSLIDLTAGFGVDSFFFAKKINNVVSCEVNVDLSAIVAHNTEVLGRNNLSCVAGDGLEILKAYPSSFDTIYVDPARRSGSSKVFRLKDCTPDVTAHLDLFLNKASRIIIKSAPLLDIKAGISELRNISEIHIISVKNECKELLWIIDKNYQGEIKIVCAAINASVKMFSFELNEIPTITNISADPLAGYLYEPDVALLKSGAFNLIAKRFGLQKLHQNSQLYFAEENKSDFIGRIFEIVSLFTITELKKEKNLIGNVIVRNFPEKAETLMKKYKITPSHDDFIVFTQTDSGYIAIKAKIVQHY